MQTTSATWKALWAAGARLETRATIAGTVYTQMSNPVVTRALTQGGMSIGNAVSASLQLAIVAPTSIPRAAELALEMRLTDGTTASEWLPAGTYYIAKRKRDPINGILSLTCYDALLKANGPATKMPWTTKAGDVMTTQSGEWLYFTGTWVRPSESVAADIALILGVEIDPRTQIQTGSAYVVDNSAGGMTLRDALGVIAAQNAGNWIMTPANKLRLVPLVSAAGAGAATQDVVDVLAITQSIDASAAGAVTGIRYGTGDEAVILGNDTGIVIDANVGAVVASDLYDALVGYTYQPYTLTGAIYDPAAELGDYVRAGANGEIASALYAETAIYSAMFNGGISAPEAGEMDDEYPYIGASAKALMASKVYAAQEVEKFDEALNQESIFNRLTDNGAAKGMYLADGELYINATYVQAGTMIANRIKGGTLTLGGLGNVDGTLRVLDAQGNQVGEWTNAGLVLYKGDIDLDSTGRIKIGFTPDGSKYALFDTNGMKLMLDSGATIRSSTQAFVGFDEYPSGITLGALSAEYTDGTSQWITTMAPAYLYVGKAENGSATYGMSYYLTEFRIYGPGYSFFVDVEHGIIGFTGSMSVDSMHVSHDMEVVGGLSVYDDLSVSGDISVAGLSGATGSFTTADGKTVTVTKGIITSIV